MSSVKQVKFFNSNNDLLMITVGGGIDISILAQPWDGNKEVTSIKLAIEDLISFIDVANSLIKNL